MGCYPTQEAIWQKLSLLGFDFISAETPCTVGIDPIVSVNFLEEIDRHQHNKIMLYTIVVILLVLWLLGLVTSYTLGGFLHILLVVAIIMLIINLIQGRRL